MTFFKELKLMVITYQRKIFQNVLIILNIGNHYEQNSWLVKYAYYLQIKIHFIGNVQIFDVEIKIATDWHTTKRSMTFTPIILDKHPLTSKFC